MKEEDIFKGAVVLARKRNCDKRSRCKILVIGVEVVTVQGNGSKFVTRKSDLRPAKITRNALKELGFIEEETTCVRKVKPTCREYIYPTEKAWQWKTRIILKNECDQWGPTRMFGGPGVHKVSYIHEVQKVINKINNQK